MLMLALSILFMLIFKLDSSIAFPKESIESKSNYPISDSDRFSWGFPGYMRNRQKESVLKFINQNKEPKQVMYTNYDPYFYMHKSLKKKHTITEATIRFTQNHPTRDKRLLPFSSMLFPPITSESKNKQFLRQLGKDTQHIPARAQISDGPYASKPDENYEDTFYKTYPSAASRITKKLYPYPNFRVFSDLNLSAPDSLHTDRPSVPNGLGIKFLKENRDIYTKIPNMKDDNLQYRHYMTILKSNGRKLQNMQQCPCKDEIKQMKDHDTAIKEQVRHFLG